MPRDPITLSRVLLYTRLCIGIAVVIGCHTHSVPLSPAAESEPVVSTAVRIIPEASTATPDQPHSHPNQPEDTESEPDNSTGATKATQPSVKGRRGRKRKNPDEKQEQSLGEKKPLRSQGEKTQEQSPGQQPSSDAKHRRRRRCGQCPGCQRLRDCGECTPCK